jgi:hypothetical protein
VPATRPPRNWHPTIRTGAGCPAWCTDHIGPDPVKGGVHVQFAQLAEVAGVRVTVWHGADDTAPCVDISDGFEGFSATDARELAELLAIAAGIGDRPRPGGRPPRPVVPPTPGLPISVGSVAPHPAPHGSVEPVAGDASCKAGTPFHRAPSRCRGQPAILGEMMTRS